MIDYVSFLNIYLYLCIFVLILGLALLVVRFSIKWSKIKYSDLRKSATSAIGIVFTIYSFISFYMYFTDNLSIGLVVMCFLGVTGAGISLLVRLKYVKHGIYMGVENAKK